MFGSISTANLADKTVSCQMKTELEPSHCTVGFMSTANLADSPVPCQRKTSF